ncbi:prepilin-type N-terminal cleavage/methylation domain-containing protein [Shewanella sp. 10N.7]|uniref:prepilin-type N-terminal cleavage/methylation domain-containing protein n=1 Tax=Shewanella sp. 10N.7 TaxID=2885093 RepID=UPI002D1F9CA3|nr:prepilin-type N-terminal cleavage/methylation domain-containing protein [Shewanella sp. 10N.7]
MSIKSVCYSNPLSNAHKGFTLIELVVVIIILAILAVIAAPKFISLKEDAYAGQMQGVSGAISSAKDLVYSACVISADCDETEGPGNGNTIEAEGQNITLAYGYPRQTEAGIARAINIVDGEDFEITSFSINPLTGLRIRPAADYSVNDCEIRYSEPKAIGEIPIVARDLDGC